jgi:hypothetical protein
VDYVILRGVVLFAAAAIFYSNVPAQGALYNGLLAASGALLLYVAASNRWYRFLGGEKLGGWGAALGFRKIILLGVVLQVAVAWITSPILTNDQRMYLQLAGSLANEFKYLGADGTRAFWPPGMPLFLAPFVAVFGVGAGAVVGANCVLYGIGASSIYFLGIRLHGAGVGLLAMLLFTLWPSRLLSAGLAAKEGLVIGASLLAVLLFLKSLDAARSGWGYAALAGLVFGLAALAQPGLLLFAVFLFISAGFYFRRYGLNYFAKCILVLFLMVAVVQSWQSRNCKIFNGEFCGVSTNGGSVFYRANNPIATGSWTPDGEIKISHLPEVEQNKLGYRLGVQWIKDNPLDFLRLGMRKLVYLLGGDGEGAYRAIQRGSGLGHEEALRENSNAREISYRIATICSLLFWIWVLIGVFRFSGIAREDAELARRGRIFFYPLIYSVGIFFVFESGDRQHMFAEGFLILLSAMACLHCRARCVA